MDEPVEDPSAPALTPVAIEARLRYLYNRLAWTQKHLAEARDAEVAAKQALLSARRRVLLAPDSPKVTRGGYTTADRDAFVDSAVEDLEFAYRIAEAAREAAQDLLRITRDQASIVQSLGVSVRQAYGMAGIVE